MEDPDQTLPVPKPTPQGDGGMTNSRFADLLQVGAEAFATQRSTPPGGWQPPSVEDLQKALPQYEITEFIARGGMGAVYKGTQKTLKRTVAIKVLPPDIDDGDMQFAERFKREAQSMAMLTHPNIVAVYDAGETAQGLLYFVMEFIEGTDVHRLIASEGRLDPARAMSITTAVCDALAFAHEEGIIHRDIKPSNIMLDKRGRVKVADFGLAKAVNLESTMLTGSNVAMGTPDFIAPEALIAGMAVDGRADVYAVGVMLYQMLTGKIPRGRFELPSGVMPQIDPRLDAIIDRAMQTDRDKRYSTATEMRTDVERIVQGSVGTPASTFDTGGGAAKNGAQKSVRTPLLAAAAVIAIAAAAFFFTRQDSESKTAAISQSQSLPVSRSSTPAESTAIKLWESASKLPSLPGISWENNALRIETNHSIPFKQVLSSDAILRASVRMNADLDSPKLIVRASAGGEGQGKKDSFYYLTLDVSQRTIKLGLRQTGDFRILKTWPMPRSYGPTEWIRLELKIIGHELTATADGTLLGTVEDSTLTGPGFVMLFAAANGFFRDIEYVPLDKSPGGNATIAIPSKPPQWESFDFATMDAKTFDAYPSGKGTLEAGLLHSTNYKGWGRKPPAPMRNVALRTTIHVDDKMSDARLTARIIPLRSGVPVRLWKHACEIFVKRGGKEQVYQRISISPELKIGDDAVLQMAAIGTRVFVWLNDRLLGSADVESGPEETGECGINATDALFRNLALLNLDGLSEAEALKILGVEEQGKDVSAAGSSAVAAPNLSPSTEPWQDMLRDPIKLKLDGGVQLTKEGLRFAGYGSAMSESRQGWKRDVAVRTLNTGNNPAQLRVRAQVAGHYRLWMEKDKMVILSRWDTADNKLTTLRAFELREAIAAGQSYQLELRVVGQTLTAKFNGKVLGTATDATVPEGGFGVLAPDHQGDLSLVEALEMLDLDIPAGK